MNLDLATVTTSPANDSGASLNADDRAAIADLLYAYAWHLDRNEPEEVGEVFSEDASLDYGPEYPTIVGRREIVEAVARGQREIFSGCSHHISNVRISPAGDEEAAVTSYVYSWTQYRSGAPDGDMWGQYHCRVRRTDEGWRIAEMVLRVAGMKNFHRGSMHPIGRRP
ncbi:MAG: nuclear transport factor 2 family protein [Acidimicrobiia bacterium]|nr:nuclear transport factor 2 family protein [Acidimicrobiia bacterium]